MKTFKTYEEIVEFVKDKENIKTLDNGEMTLKEWIEDHESLEKFKKDYGLATNDKKTLRSKNEELTKTVAEITAQLTPDSSRLTPLLTYRPSRLNI
jgi:mannose-6-phosphate isomerase class I